MRLQFYDPLVKKIVLAHAKTDFEIVKISPPFNLLVNSEVPPWAKSPLLRGQRKCPEGFPYCTVETEISSNVLGRLFLLHFLPKPPFWFLRILDHMNTKH